ncbi:glycoside hydrolase family 2 protein [Microlunatus sp. GCM10028923]|uniref:glycoside hydrolase family 2 protein n=1 Tax=Microlunatus sp. GCM10028923 TaxID=3273400 RepID=UPI00360CC84F
MRDRAGSRTVEGFNDDWIFFAEELPAATRWDELPTAGEPVTLPHTWNAVDGQDGGNDYRRGRSTYAKRFGTAPEAGETWLEFRGANSSAEVHLNGTELGRHDGGYSTFRVDLTGALREDNTLLVIVDNAANDRIYPQRADFTFYGGLYRDVNLIKVPPAHFRLDDHGGPGLVITPQLAGDRAQVLIRAEVTGGSTVRFAIDGVESRTVPVTDGAAETMIEIPEVRRWHGRRDPYRYLATAELLDGDDPVDRVRLRFGCREFAIDPDRGFLLNGEPYPLRGVSRHQDWEGVGNAVTPEQMETDLALLTELGASTVRLAHYQHDQYFYDLCDHAGLVVWAEIPQITSFLPDGTRNATDQLTELIIQNRHHPSIVCWGLSNEITIGGTSEQSLAFHRELNDLAHRLDPTRPTVMAHAFILETDDPLMTVPDVCSYNLYYGWYLGELEDNDRWFADFRAAHPGVPIGLSEYGADANVQFQTGTPICGDYTEQYQARYHEHLLQLIDASPYLWATHVWNFADFGADGREEGGWPGRNQKGLVTFDRKIKKDAFYLYKAAWSDEPFVHLCGSRYADRPEDTTEVTVYANRPEVELWCDDRLVERQTGSRVFRFSAPITGEHRIVARSGDLTDSMIIRRVEQPNPDYAIAAGGLTNWFDAELDSPDGYYSIHDTLADIKRSPEGRALVQLLLDAAAARTGDVAKDVQLPEGLQAIVDRMTVASLIRHAGDTIRTEQVVALNRELNSIERTPS